MEETERESRPSETSKSAESDDANKPMLMSGSTSELTAGSTSELTDFANRIATSLIKETITETNTVKIWSIPCSAGCHNSHQNTGTEASCVQSHLSSSLCWTPESQANPSSSSAGETCSEKLLHKGGGEKMTCGANARDNGDTKEMTQKNLHVNSNEEGLQTSSSQEPSEDTETSKTSSPPQLTEIHQTDLVHYRLSSRSRDTLSSSRDLLQADRPEDEFRNKSAENLAHPDASLLNGTKQSLRKGLSVNDIPGCGPASPTPPKGRTSFLRSFGLRRHQQQQRDEVTMKLSPEESSSSDRPGGRKKIKSLRKTFTNIFHFKHPPQHDQGSGSSTSLFKIPRKRNKSVPPGKRALPPVPAVDSRTPSPQSELELRLEGDEGGGVPGGVPPPLEPRPPLPTETAAASEEDSQMDFALSIQKVKDRGWYWGPLSGEAAERILSAEPDGSFVVRDSSDHHYIFSLTFKLNGFVRHVRIEHDQGNFSFGSFTKFKSNTIVEFIENAVEHSRSGRYLFFLHRRPVLGPMRVQLLHPVSRFKRVQSLQHLCRYVIVKHVRKDHLDDLPVPNKIKLYLNTPFYYSEQVEEEVEEESEEDGEEDDVSLPEADVSLPDVAVTRPEDAPAAASQDNSNSGQASLEVHHPSSPSPSSTSCPPAPPP